LIAAKNSAKCRDFACFLQCSAAADRCSSMHAAHVMRMLFARCAARLANRDEHTRA
jgi:hypothetical protein